MSDLKDSMMQQLDVFLQSETQSFVDILFKVQCFAVVITLLISNLKYSQFIILRIAKQYFQPPVYIEKSYLKLCPIFVKLVFNMNTIFKVIDNKEYINPPKQDQIENVVTETTKLKQVSSFWTL